MFTLGISAYYHDSAAVLLKNDEIIAAAQEERFSRKKFDASFPAQAIKFCLDFYGLDIDDIDYVAFIRWENAIILSLSIIVATFAVGILLKIARIDRAIYYRPHEQFLDFDHKMGVTRYKKNIRFEMNMPHGDLKHLAVAAKVSPEPRHVDFHTDSVGFRNLHDYSGQQHIILGDSFIAGNGVSQEDLITEELKNYSIDSYNLGISGNLNDYANLSKAFEKLYGSNHKILLFLFEGNDFPIYQKTEHKSPTLKQQIQKALNWYYIVAFKKRLTYRFMYSVTRKFAYHLSGENVERVKVRSIKGIPVAFYKSYIAVSKRDYLPQNSQSESYIAELSKKISHIFFIPTKYRVYYKYLSDNEENNTKILPNKQWEYVQIIGKKFGIPVTNLTPAIIKKSDNLIESGKLTFWKDDTHWNKHGIAVAAKIVAHTLKKTPPISK